MTELHEALSDLVAGWLTGEEIPVAPRHIERLSRRARTALERIGADPEKMEEIALCSVQDILCWTGRKTLKEIEDFIGQSGFSLSHVRFFFSDLARSRRQKEDAEAAELLAQQRRRRELREAGLRDIHPEYREFLVEVRKIKNIDAIGVYDYWDFKWCFDKGFTPQEAVDFAIKFNNLSFDDAQKLCRQEEARRLLEKAGFKVSEFPEAEKG